MPPLVAARFCNTLYALTRITAHQAARERIAGGRVARFSTPVLHHRDARFSFSQPRAR